MSVLGEVLEREVRAGLSSHPLRTPAALLYDALGSALFEAITYLPEYELTRVDLGMLAQHSAKYLGALKSPIELVELGPGAGRKALVMLEVLLAKQLRARFVAVDVSAQALHECRRALESLEGLQIETVEATYLEGLSRAVRTSATRLVCFLGSNLSNFERPEAAQFFRDVRGKLRSGDGFLLAVDLEKRAEQVLPAYDDALGVTASFNRNVLVRLAREAGSTLPLDAFAHRVKWNSDERRVEMHLEALRDVAGEVLGLPVSLKKGETVWTESSHRFSLNELNAWAEAAGFRVAHAEVASPWAFAQVLYVVP